MASGASRKTRLTSRATAILAYISHMRETHGAPPTLREIGRRFGIRSTNGVRYYIDLLEREGVLLRRPGLARGIALPSGSAARNATRARATVRRGVPILGRIAAGGPVFSAEHFDGTLDFNCLGSAQPDFALRVKGDSMRDAGIFDGDLVLVRQDPAPRNGEIVVAMIGDEATVKRFFQERGRVRLQPENPSYEQILVTERSPQLRILGRVVGVFREIQ